MEGSGVLKAHHLQLQWHGLLCATVKLSSCPPKCYVVAEAMCYLAMNSLKDAYGACSLRNVVFAILVVCCSYLLDRLGR